jgi:transposase
VIDGSHPCRALSMRATAGDGGGAARTLARRLSSPASISQTLGICSRSRRDDGVVVRSLTRERLVRVVRLMLAHGRVVVTMRHGRER